MARRRRSKAAAASKTCGRTCTVLVCVLVVLALVAGFIGGYFLFFFKHAPSGDGSKYGDHCDPDNKLSCSSPNLTCSTSSKCVCSPNYVLDDSNPSNVFCIKRTDKPGPVVSVILVLPGSPGQWLYKVSFQPSPGPVESYSLVINDEQATGTDTTYTFRTLYPGQNCNYAITAYNGMENPSEASVGIFRLNTTCPEDVRYLRATQDDDNALVLTFMCPDPRDVPGNIQGYTIQKILLSPAGLPETKTIYTFPASQVLCTNSFNDGALGGVLVERNYTFSVRAFNDRFVGNYSQGITFYVAPRVPKLSLTYGGLKLLQKLDNSELKHTEFEVRVCTSCLLDATRGPVLGAGLVVCVQGNGNNCAVSGITQVSDLSSWDDARRTNFDVLYLTTPTDWLISLKAPPLELNYIIGHDSSCTSQHNTTYCNGPLPTDKQITVIVVKCNIAGCGQLQYNDIFSTKEPGTGINKLALGIGMVWVVFLLVVGAVLYVTGKKLRASCKRLRNPFKEEEHIYDVLSDTKSQTHGAANMAMIMMNDYCTFPSPPKPQLALSPSPPKPQLALSPSPPKPQLALSPSPLKPQLALSPSPLKPQLALSPSPHQTSTRPKPITAPK